MYWIDLYYKIGMIGSFIVAIGLVFWVIYKIFEK